MRQMLLFTAVLLSCDCLIKNILLISHRHIYARQRRHNFGMSLHMLWYDYHMYTLLQSNLLNKTKQKWSHWARVLIRQLKMSVMLWIRALIMEGGPNKQRSYWAGLTVLLSPSDNGKITLIGLIDYETVSEYLITVACHDLKYTVYKNITINILVSWYQLILKWHT